MNSLWASRRIVATAAGVPLAALAIAACGGGSDTPRPPKTASGQPADHRARVRRRTRQGAYNGRPLHRYTGDAKLGDTNRQRVTAFGAAWFAVSGAGEVVSRPASKRGGGSID